SLDLSFKSSAPYTGIHKRYVGEDFAQFLSLGEASIRTRSLFVSARDQKKTNLTSDFDNDSSEASDADVSLQTLSSSSKSSEATTSEADDLRF
ncbi:hypothetical protein A2U01_0016970, partial [Trifolium medium]|nr:hypothetical protein [Trifolium medium]